MAGYRAASNWLVGGYGGLKPGFYASEIDPAFRQVGAFARYLGPKARTLTVSLNELRYSGQTERRFLYLNGLLPLHDRAVLYGNMEFELASQVRREDRLSRLFVNGRFEVTDAIDVTANYSSGRGLRLPSVLAGKLSEYSGKRHRTGTVLLFHAVRGFASDTNSARRFVSIWVREEVNGLTPVFRTVLLKSAFLWGIWREPGCPFTAPTTSTEETAPSPTPSTCL